MAATHRYFRYFTYIQPVIRAPFIRTYGSLILTILALITFIVFAIKPTVETILILQKEVSNQRQILERLNAKAKNLSLGRKNYQALDQTTKDKIHASVPATPEIAAFSKSLENVAKVSEASLSAIQFQSFVVSHSSKKLSLAEIPFNYNVGGQYGALLKILTNLQSTDRLISIDQISFNKIEGSPNILLSVSGKGYFLK